MMAWAVPAPAAWSIAGSNFDHDVVGGITAAGGEDGCDPDIGGTLQFSGPRPGRRRPP